MANEQQQTTSSSQQAAMPTETEAPPPADASGVDTPAPAEATAPADTTPALETAPADTSASAESGTPASETEAPAPTETTAPAETTTPTETAVPPETTAPANSPPQNEIPSATPAETTITAADDHFTTEQNSPLAIHGADLLANDTPLPGQPLHVLSVGQGAHGIASYDAANDLLTFQPNDDFLGHTTFPYTVADDAGHSAAAMVDVFIVTEVANGPPRPEGDHVSTQADHPLTLDTAQLLANDQDPQDLPMTIAGARNASHGTVQFDPQSSQITFTPDQNFVGTAGFDYVVTDPTHLSATGHVTVDVTAPLPITVDDHFSTEQGALLVVRGADLLANDTAPAGGQLHLTSVGQSAHARVNYDAANDVIVVQSDESFLGHATFPYTVADHAGHQADGQVDVMVSPEVALGAPIPHPDTFSTVADQQLTLTTAQLLANDHAPLDLPMTVAAAQNASHGTLQFDFQAKQIIFTPSQHFVGTAGFDYVITDSTHMGLSGHVTVNVKAPPPIAADDFVTARGGSTTTLTASRLLANDHTALPNDPLHIASVDDPADGTVRLATNGDVKFTPDKGFVGNTAFDYTVADKFGGTDSATVHVHVTSPPAQPPSEPTVEVHEVVHTIIQTIPVFVHVPATQVAATPQPTLAWFAGHSDAHGTELWTTDGRVAGESADISPGARSSSPSQLHLIGDTLFLSANDGTHGREPWIFDGDTARLMADLRPGAESSNPRDYTLSNRALFFSADDGYHGRELWTADFRGVHQVSDIAPGAPGSHPVNLLDVSGTLYFTADDRVHGTELWQVGTDGGASIVADMAPGEAGSNPHDLTAIGDTLYFVANDGVHGRELFHLSAGSEPVVEDVFAGPGSAFPAAPANHALASVDGALVAAAEVPGQGLTLFTATPSDQHLHPLTQLGIGAEAAITSVQTEVAAKGHTVYVAATDSEGNSVLARYDMDTNHLTPNLAPGTHAAPADLTMVGETLFFTALNGVSDGQTKFRDLWEDDSTGLHRVDLGSDRTLPRDLVQADGRLLFTEDGHLHAVGPHLAVTPIPASNGLAYEPAHIVGVPPDAADWIS